MVGIPCWVEAACAATTEAPHKRWSRRGGIPGEPLALPLTLCSQKKSSPFPDNFSARLGTGPWTMPRRGQSVPPMEDFTGSSFREDQQASLSSASRQIGSRTGPARTETFTIDQYSGQILHLQDRKNFTAGETFLEWQYPRITRARPLFEWIGTVNAPRSSSSNGRPCYRPTPHVQRSS
jgi:hypothetical protein